MYIQITQVFIIIYYKLNLSSQTICPWLKSLYIIKLMKHCEIKKENKRFTIYGCHIHPNEI